MLLAGIVIVLLVVGLPLMTYLLREPICQGKYLPFMRGWVQLFIPPGDLYGRIADEPLDISVIGKKTLVFSLKYIGPYSIKIFPRDMPKGLSGTKYDTPLQATMEFYSDEKLIMKKDFKYDKSWGLGRGDGVPQFEVHVPSELPIEKNITCLVNIVVPDPYLAENCDIRLLIGKRSEE